MIKADIEQYMSNNPCPKCKGARLRKEALSVKINDLNISQFTNLSVKEELQFINNIEIPEMPTSVSCTLT